MDTQNTFHRTLGFALSQRLDTDYADVQVMKANLSEEGGILTFAAADGFTASGEDPEELAGAAAEHIVGAAPEKFRTVGKDYDAARRAGREKWTKDTTSAKDLEERFQQNDPVAERLNQRTG